MHINETCDVWHRLKTTEKPIVLYGMGNGADKILSVMETLGVEAADFFASDGFVRGHQFHGKRVLSFSEAREKYPDMLILISFASALPELLARFDELDADYETMAPDVPVSGDTLFTWEWFCEHRADFEAAYALLADDESRRIFENLIDYKLSGKLKYLRAAVSDQEAVLRELVVPEQIRTYMDLGAYNGDTVRSQLAVSPALETVWAMEPDARNFRKLSAYAEQETRADIRVYPYAAWNCAETLTFRVEGNRNSTLAQNGTRGITVSQAKEKQIEAQAPDAVLGGAQIDYIKYDVEGAEREALLGTAQTIRTYAPKLLVSLYHRTEDLYVLPQLIHAMQPQYRMYLRRFPYVPAWDINLYCIKDA
ncbi:MAG: FkbM family methyltransferase [Clostridia bacterium]|nr:FkbM family methyltransferase [Clostridia bacterium]